MVRPVLLLAWIVPFVVAAAPQDKTPTITVVGEGVVRARPDMAVVSIGVVTEAPRAADALSQNSRAMSDTIATAKEGGIAPRDIETDHISLNPQYSYPKPGAREVRTLTGYEASNGVTIRVRAFDKLGELLDRLVSSGANRIRGIALTLADPEPLQDGARAEAMKNARRKAELLADAAGVRIVRLFSATEQYTQPPRPMMRMAASAPAAERAAVPVEAGEQEIHARVSAVFEIAPK